MTRSAYPFCQGELWGITNLSLKHSYLMTERQGT